MSQPTDCFCRSGRSPLTIFIVACFALIATGCSDADAASVTSEVPSSLTLRWLKGDNHLHTRHSDGSGTPTQTANTAKSLGYGFATLTDHNTTAGNAEMEAQSTATFVGLGGEEVTRGDGHYLAFGITSTVSAGGTPQQMIDAVNANNPGTSFGYIAHLMWSTAMTQGGDWEWHDWSVTGYAGLEVWNAYYPHNYATDYSLAAFAQWDELNRAGRHLYGMTNSDAHSSNVGNASGSSLGLGYGFDINKAAARFAYAGIPATRDMTVQSTLKGVRYYGNHVANVGVVGRYVDAANTYIFYWTHAGDAWRLGKYVGGTWTTLASSASAPLEVGKAVTVRLVLSGSNVAGYVDGALKVSATDSSLSSGKAGLYGWSVKSTRELLRLRHLGLAHPKSGERELDGVEGRNASDVIRGPDANPKPVAALERERLQQLERGVDQPEPLDALARVPLALGAAVPERARGREDLADPVRSHVERSRAEGRRALRTPSRKIRDEDSTIQVELRLVQDHPSARPTSSSVERREQLAAQHRPR
jgi:hypothetical protein